MPESCWLLSLTTTADATASRLANDRSMHSGGQQIAELLIYDRVLTDSERKSVEVYLMNKWFGSDGSRKIPN